MNNIKIAICFYGYNRNFKHLINLKNFFKHYFDEEVIISVYYSTYSTESDFDTTPIDVEDIKRKIRENNVDIESINIIVNKYDETHFLKEIKSTGKKTAIHSSRRYYFHRELGMYYNMMKAYTAIKKDSVDYVLLTRFDWGINHIRNIKKINIKRIIDYPNIITGHLNNNTVHGIISMDPRFIFGSYKNMSCFENIYNFYLSYLSKNIEDKNTVHCHYFITILISHIFNMNTVSLHTMFCEILHLQEKANCNIKLNNNKEEEKRIEMIYKNL